MNDLKDVTKAAVEAAISALEKTTRAEELAAGVVVGGSTGEKELVQGVTGERDLGLRSGIRHGARGAYRPLPANNVTKKPIFNDPLTT